VTDKKEMKEIKENQTDSKPNKITMHVPPREKEDVEMNRMMRCDNDYQRAVVIYLRSNVQIEVWKEK